MNFKIAAALVAGVLITMVLSNAGPLAGGGRKFLGDAGALFKETFFPDENFEEVAVIPLGVRDTEEKKEMAAAKVSARAASAKTCDFNSGKIAVPEKIIFNEIAWMGSSAGFDKEWIELKNISEESANISGFQILDKDEQIKIIFSDKTIVPAGGFYLLERGEEAVPGVKADIIYAGNLRNADEALKLFDGDCNLIDEVVANPNWPAGDNKNKFTMERNGDGTGWHTSSIKEGTPGKGNSAAINPIGPISPISPIGTGATTSEITTPSPRSSLVQTVAVGKININTAGYEELQKITGVGPVIAQRIIDYRNANGPFARIENIKNVKGIGEVTFEKMKDEITL